MKNPGHVVLGRYRTALNSEFEAGLVEHVLLIQHMMFGLSTSDIRQLAFDLAEKKKVVHPFRLNNKMAGKDWLRGFLRRHTEISIRSPKSTSLGRAVGFNKPSVD